MTLEPSEVSKRYTLIKEEATKQYNPPLFRKFQMIWEIPPLQAVQKPSEILTKLFRWLPPSSDRNHFLVREFFFSRLPPEMQNYCARHNDISLQDLAADLDAMKRPSGHPAAVAVPADEPLGEVQSNALMSAAIRNFGMCWVHRRFKDKATSCKNPKTCTFRSKTGNA